MWFSLNYPGIINQKNPHWVGIVSDLKAAGASKDRRFFLGLLLNREDIALSAE
jgi:hypothetical protein